MDCISKNKDKAQAAKNKNMINVLLPQKKIKLASVFSVN
jgi:hypothetical protein